MDEVHCCKVAFRGLAGIPKIVGGECSSLVLRSFTERGEEIIFVVRLSEYRRLKEMFGNAITLMSLNIRCYYVPN